jgi:cysteine desulfurase/selenocysteine lyase
MTTNLSTGNPYQAGRSAPGAGAGDWPSNLPGPEVLARLANEFFAALPGAAVDSRSLSGQNIGSTVPATLGIELGGLPFVPTVPPASAFGPPTEEPLLRALRDAAEVGGSYPQPLVTAPPFGSAQSLYYFLGSPEPTSPRTTPASPGATDLRHRSAPRAAVPVGSPLTAAGEVSELSFYFLDELRSFTASAPAVEGASAPGSPEEVPEIASAHPAFDAEVVRRDFPILEERVHGRPLVWLDNAATTQKPQVVIDRLSYFYRHENSNIHRAAHELAARATDAYEAARDKVARFLHAGSSDEIVFLRGTTEAINLVAHSWGRQNVGAGDEIVITWLEHHANIVPWQQLCSATGARLRVAPVDDRGQILLDEYEKLLGPRTRLVAFSQVSNALGTITPAREMVEIAHRYGVRVLVDGAQAVSHMPVDVQTLDCDWYVFSGHKVFGPTGIGALYGKLDLLNATLPWQGGGNMIQDVTFERTTYQAAPARFEAGTGNIADAVGLGAALDYVEKIGLENIARYEHELLVYATRGLHTVPGLTIVGNAVEKAGVLSFVLDGFRSEEVGEALNREGIAVRAGHHCAQPILRRFGVESTVRASLAFCNTWQDIDALVAALLRIQGGSTELRH